MPRPLVVALLLVTGCGARSALDEGRVSVAEAPGCNEIFPAEGRAPTISVAAAADGLVVAGSFDGVIQLGSHTLTSEGNALFVARLDAACEVVWARRFSADAYWVDVAATRDGGAVVAGRSGQAGVDFGVGHQGGERLFDTFVAGLDAGGAVRWSRLVEGRIASGIANGRGAGMAVDAEDGVILTGSFDETTDCGGGLLAGSPGGGGAVFVARYDAGGAHRWSRSIPAADEISGVSGERVVLDAAGDIVIAGDLWGRMDLAGATLDSGSFPQRGFVARLDAAGQPIAASLLPDPPFEGALQAVEAMVADPVSGVFVVAPAYNDGYVVDAKQVLRLDAAGQPGWVNELHFFDNGSMHSGLAPSAGGGVWYVDGCNSLECSFPPGGGPDNGPSVHVDVVAARYDAAGAVAWSQRWGSKKGSNLGQAAAVDGGGRLILGGLLSETLDFGAGPIVVPGDNGLSDATDLFLVRLP